MAVRIRRCRLIVRLTCRWMDGYEQMGGCGRSGVWDRDQIPHRARKSAGLLGTLNRC